MSEHRRFFCSKIDGVVHIHDRSYSRPLCDDTRPYLPTLEPPTCFYCMYEYRAITEIVADVQRQTGQWNGAQHDMTWTSLMEDSCRAFSSYKEATSPTSETPKSATRSAT